jgi:sn-glycerol 3-phosphate transport system permease protein
VTAAGGGRPRTPPVPLKRAVFRNRRLPYLLVLPQVLLTLVFFVWPALGSIRLALYRTSAFGDRLVFVGADNFTRLLRSEDYLRSALASGLFAGGVTVGELAVSLGLAVLANQAIRGRALYRAALLWPYGLAPAVAGVLCLYIFHPVYGIVPFWAGAYASVKLNWLVHEWVAMLMLVSAAIWKQLGYNVVLFLAGLQAVPSAVLEAAQVDGATASRRFWRIVFPMLSPVTFFLVVMNVVFAFFDTFGLIHTLTQGGPGNATEILVYKAYRDAFAHQRFGSSAAQSVVLMIIVVALTVAQFRYAERRVAY